jgi:hypothetical protein
MKQIAVSIHFLFAFFYLVSAIAAEDKVEYQDRRNDYPDFYQNYPLINLDLKSEETSVSFLRYTNPDRFTKTDFDTVTAPAGKELSIRGYWISKNLIKGTRISIIECC